MKNGQEIMSDIMEHIECSYGSMESPNWSFAQDRYNTGSHEAIVRDLGILGPILETTDLNTDVSACFSIRSPSHEGLGVKISLVGPYVCINDDKGNVFGNEDMTAEEWLRDLYKVFCQHNITLLDPCFITKELEFGGSTVSLYSILFSDDDAVERL